MSKYAFIRNSNNETQMIVEAPSLAAAKKMIRQRTNLRSITGRYYRVEEVR